MTPVEAAAVRPVVRAPEPAFFWIRYAPRGWPPPDAAWLDPARGGLGVRPGDRGAAGQDSPLVDLSGGPFDDVVWLPPVTAERTDERDRIAAEHVARGTPVLVHLLPGDPPPPDGAVGLHDLLPALLRRDLAALAAVPAGAACVWPLVSGVTDDLALWRDGSAALGSAGAAVVQGAVPRLVPVDRRRLAHGLDEAAFQALFHGGDPDERAFARAAAAAGLRPFLPRPLPRPPATGAASRRIAGALFLAAELWLRLGRAPQQGQDFFRAARWIDESQYDAEALAREGNLGVVEAIGPASRAVIEDAAAHGGEPALLAELLAEYTAP